MSASISGSRISQFTSTYVMHQQILPKTILLYVCELYILLTRCNGYCFATPSMSVATTKFNWFYVVLLKSAECESLSIFMYASDSHCVYFTLESALFDSGIIWLDQAKKIWYYEIEYRHHYIFSLRTDCRSPNFSICSFYFSTGIRCSYPCSLQGSVKSDQLCHTSSGLALYL